jgi:hypothetical protein
LFFSAILIGEKSCLGLVPKAVLLRGLTLFSVDLSANLRSDVTVAVKLVWLFTLLSTIEFEFAYVLEVI